MKSSQNILFSGAGFTKNFGGLLAKEMWSKIFNHFEVQSQIRLKDLILNDFDYESIYHKIMNGDFTEKEKKSINNVIYNAYKVLDDICCQWTFRKDVQYPVNIYGINKFIQRFSGSKNKFGFFFTLNQDLFIERHFNSPSHNTAIIHPGVPKIPNPNKPIFNLSIENEDFINVPTLNELKNNKVNPLSRNVIHYVKLHGSFGWKSSKGADSYVIGKEKEKQVSDEPLLSWYFELFKNVLSEPNKKLLLIGYGFRDRHINEVIANSVENNGLKIYIISPSEQSSFMKNLKSEEYGEKILKGLSGYYPYKLLEIFPSDQSNSHAWKEILDSYFNR